MIRKLSINDKSKYLELLEQLTTVGNISDSQWFLLFRKLEDTKNIEIYVLVGVNDRDNTQTDSNETEPPESSEVILAAGTLLIEQKFIHDGAIACHIEDVVVAEKARGLGLGKLIVEHLVNRAKEVGAYKVILNTSEETSGFYSKLGFKKHEIQMRFDLV